MQVRSSLIQRRCRLPAGAVAVSLLCLFAGSTHSAAQVPTGQEPLAFAGFTAGSELAEITSSLRRRQGQRLRCTRSSADSTVQECRGTYPDSATGRTVEVWLSAIGGSAGVLTLKTEGTTALLERWRSELSARYGRVATSVQGAQRMMQWVRKGRMIRLTWRRDRAATVISVSLVDGHILDGWGRRLEGARQMD